MYKYIQFLPNGDTFLIYVWNISSMELGFQVTIQIFHILLLVSPIKDYLYRL